MPRRRTGPDHYDRMFGALEHIREGMLAGGEIAERIRAGTEIVVFVSQLGPGADHADLELAAAPALADARVENGGLMPRVRAPDQKRVGLLNAGDTRIENIGGAAGFWVEGIAALDRQIDRALLRQQILEREHLFPPGELSGDAS